MQLFSCMSLEGRARSGLFLSVSVLSPPWEAQNLWFWTILSEISENHVCILRYLATVALKKLQNNYTCFVKCSQPTIKWEVPESMLSAWLEFVKWGNESMERGVWGERGGTVRVVSKVILMHLSRGLSSKLIIPPSVRPCVRPPPWGSSKHMLLHHTVWNFRKSSMYFTVLSYGRLQNTT